MKIIKVTEPETLLRARLDYLDNDPSMATYDREAVSINMRKYLEKHIPAGDFYAFAVTVGGRMASIGFMSVTEMPPSAKVPNGKVGTLFNILTYPEFRGRGYGSMLVQAIIEEGRRLGLSVIDLHATELGAGLYERLGFERIPYEVMWLKMSKQ